MKTTPYIEIALQLKKLHFVEWDISRKSELTRGQKSAVTKLFRKYKEIIRHPERFHSPPVKAEKAALLKESGFVVSKSNRAWIPKGEYTSVSIKGDFITRSRGSGEKEKTFLDKGLGLEDRVAKLFKKKLNNNQMLTFRIGDSAPFNVRFDDPESMYHYIQAWEPEDDEDHNKLMRLMTIVEVPPLIQKRRTGGKKKQKRRTKRDG